MARECTVCQREKPDDQFRKWRGQCTQCEYDIRNERVTLLRLSIIEQLGGRCVALDCGIDDPRMLDIDHIHGGGSRERRESGSGEPYYRSMLPHLHDFQILCANHNRLKRFMHAETRRQGKTQPTPDPREARK